MNDPSKEDITAVARWLHAAASRESKRVFQETHFPWESLSGAAVEMYEAVAHDLLINPPQAVCKAVRQNNNI